MFSFFSMHILQPMFECCFSFFLFMFILLTHNNMTFTDNTISIRLYQMLSKEYLQRELCLKGSYLLKSIHKYTLIHLVIKMTSITFLAVWISLRPFVLSHTLPHTPCTLEPPTRISATAKIGGRGVK